MAASLAHRGPDGEGFDRAPGFALAHRRLAILDLSRAGAQPMRSRDGRYTIALNGEIFNYRELRAELPGPFRSATDTEALLEACAAWGIEAALERANGMFAFALWDAGQGELTLVRDRCGEKPLVYLWDGKTFAFASELKALAPLHSGRLDPVATDAYLALGYVPAPLAIFRNCHKLPAGHLLRFHDGRIDMARWWRPEAALRRPSGSSVELLEELRDHLRDAVGLRLHADVPVALALSGGVDSSIIAAECAASKAATDAFTVVIDGDQAELPLARSAARHLRLQHRVIEVRGESAERQMELAAMHYDEPFADSSALPTLALARAISEQGGYKVVLTGDGGDEAFAGYPHYEHIRAKQWLKAAAAAAGFGDGSGATGVYVQSKTLFRRRERERLLGANSAGDSFSELLASDSYLPLAPGDALHQALWRDRHLYLANDLTFKTDIALAAFGIEGRAPFLDHRLLEWAQNLESRHLARGREKKILPRQAYRDRLPEGLLARGKHGFGSPIQEWLAGPLRRIAGKLLPCPLLDASAQHNGSGQRLWTLLSFALWARTWNARW